MEEALRLAVATGIAALAAGAVYLVRVARERNRTERWQELGR